MTDPIPDAVLRAISECVNLGDVVTANGRSVDLRSLVKELITMREIARMRLRVPSIDAESYIDGRFKALLPEYAP